MNTMNTDANTLREALKDVIAQGLANAIDYQTYRKQVKQWAEENSNSGPEKSDVLANYTQLNDRRMKRWDKTLKFTEAQITGLPKLDGKYTWLVITESWCGDAAPSVPVMNKIAESLPNLDLKLVYRDENLPLIEQFLTNGAMSIPKLIMIDSESLQVKQTWGPRSTKATKMVNEYKAEHGKLTAEFKEDLQGFYNKDKGQDVFNDLVALLALE
ncbi:thioredoxin family protein [Flavobacterium sp. ASW18X]|nr:thioredoxin family protein [Flavobacterium sp. ASW18X]